MNHQFWSSIMRAIMPDRNAYKPHEKIDHLNLYIQTVRVFSIEIRVFFKLHGGFEIMDMHVFTVNCDATTKLLRRLRPMDVGGSQNLAILAITIMAEIAVSISPGFEVAVESEFRRIIGTPETGIMVPDMNTNGESWLKLFNRQSKKLLIFHIPKHDPERVAFAILIMQKNAVCSYKAAKVPTVFSIMENPEYYLENFKESVELTLVYIDHRLKAHQQF